VYADKEGKISTA